jgi:hypothetical protein
MSDADIVAANYRDPEQVVVPHLRIVLKNQLRDLIRKGLFIGGFPRPVDVYDEDLFLLIAPVCSIQVLRPCDLNASQLFNHPNVFEQLWERAPLSKFLAKDSCPNTENK